MKYTVLEIPIIFVLCFLELLKVASSNQRLKAVDIIDNFIGLAEPPSHNNDEINKRNSIVDGGVFVPYKSTTIVYKSRLVPVTYGFVIKKETLKDNPALYKLGVKLLDDKVEPTPKQLLDEKKVVSASKQLLEAKSKCVEGSKVLRLLAKLSSDINNIEKAILAQNQSVLSEHEEIIAKSLKEKTEKVDKHTKEKPRPHPQHEEHVSGHKGEFEKGLNTNNGSQNNDISKNLSRYWQCRRSHTPKKCAVLLLMKRRHSNHSANHHVKHYRKHPARHATHKKRHSAGNTIHGNHETKHSVRHTTHEKKHSARHTSHEILKHSIGHDSHHRQHLDKYKNKSAKHSVRFQNRKKTFTKGKPSCKFCKQKHKQKKAKHRHSLRKHWNDNSHDKGL